MAATASKGLGPRSFASGNERGFREGTAAEAERAGATFIITDAGGALATWEGVPRRGALLLTAGETVTPYKACKYAMRLIRSTRHRATQRAEKSGIKGS